MSLPLRNLVLRITVVLLMTASFCYAGERVTPDTDPIPWEISIGASHYHASNEWSGWGFGPEEEEITQLTSEWRYYFDTRFANPVVPFTFIPYDYSASLVEGYVTYLRSNTSIDSLFNRKLSTLEFGAGGLYYFTRHFVRGSITYSRLTNPGRDNQLEIQAGAGWYGSKLEVGLGVVAQRLYCYITEDKWFGPNPHLEYTPSSFVRLRTSLRLLYDLDDGSNWYYELPVTLSHTIPESWWEFTGEFVYFRSSDRYNIYRFGSTVRKYVGDHSVWLTGNYVKGIRFWPGFTFYSVRAGSSLVLLDRRLIARVAYSYGFGDSHRSRQPEDTGREHTVELALSLFML